MSPIRASERSRYPKNWREISLRAREKAGHRCEVCKAPDRALVWRVTGSTDWADCETMPEPADARQVRIVLTVAHLDHTPENCDPRNLVAMCQLCHNTYDAPMRAAGRKARRLAAQHAGAIALPFLAEAS